MAESATGGKEKKTTTPDRRRRGPSCVRLERERERERERASERLTTEAGNARERTGTHLYT